ncbi:Mth938-like domain-containing protein [Curvibacter sp. CHRR-16]|uniref:Mth938-like domain-containing protein n=1 Tax=Curvibacter sp. CHRR-16 TaxID=2835872 RepID=UPI001BD9D26F|nr:Mth938-like domain-containing protein [Curvibacter sp. CHRR-16]MBT0571120.1 Mth938-like domain-containing protein [Curvibacter sp. CHRR-16]
MKLIPDTLQGPSIQAYGPGWIGVSGQKHSGGLLVSSQYGVQAWDVQQFSDLDLHHMEALGNMGAEIIILGTGQQLRWVPAPWMAKLGQKRVGLECMDTGAACRSYNFLMAEGRKVIAALLPL